MGRPRAFSEEVAVRNAMDLFWRKGYQATTPADLGAALGLSRGSLYNAFGSKHELYQRALRAYIDDQRRQFLEALDIEGPASERIRAALAVVLGDRREPRGCMITMAAVEAPPDDPDTTRLVRAVLAEQRRALGAAIEDGRRAGDLPGGPDRPTPKEAAAAIVALMNGVRVMQRAGAAPGNLVELAMRLI